MKRGNYDNCSVCRPTAKRILRQCSYETTSMKGLMTLFKPPAEYTLIGVGAILLSKLKKPITVSALWEEIREEKSINTYERFVTGLDFLFLIGALEIQEGRLYKKRVGSSV